MDKALFAIILFTPFTLSFALAPKPASETFFDRLMKEQSSIDLIKGSQFMRENRYREAAVEFAKALDKNPISASYAMYGAALYWLGDIDGSIQQYEEAIKKDDKNAIAWQLMGISKARKGMADEALNDFLKALELDPSRPDVNMNIGSIYFSKGFMESSLSYMKNALRHDPYSPLYAYQLGLVYFYLERYQEAEELFSRAISSAYDYEEAILWLGLTLEREGRENEAIKKYTKAISLKPGDFFARYKAASIFFKKGKNKEVVSQIASSLLIRRSSPNSGLSLFIAYGGGKNDNSKDDSVKKFSNSTLDQIYKNLIKAPNDRELSFSIDIISTPRLKIEKVKERSYSNKKYSNTKKRYAGKTITIPPSSIEQRESAISSALASLESETILDDANYDHKINFYMSFGPSAKEKKNTAVYSPREVGNQMGLWVYGNNWLDVLSEDIENFPETPSSDVEAMLMGLAFLLYGDGQQAFRFFDMASDSFPEEAYLGKAAALVSEGREKEAEGLLDMALKKYPRNKLLIENLKWLKNDK